MFRLNLLCGVALAFLLTGCAASKLDLSLKSPSTSYKVVERPLPVVIGVDSFVDLRPQTRGSDNKKWLGFIPGVLWIEIDSDIPEIYTAFSPFNSRPMNVSVAEAIADSMARSSLCERVVFLPENPYEKVDYRLEGILRRSLVQETGYYYGSSMYAWLTRILSLPYVSYRVTLEADLRLRSMRDNRIVWRGRISGSRQDKYHSVYDLARGKDGKHLIAYQFARIIEEQLNGIFKGMEQAIEGQNMAASGL